MPWSIMSPEPGPAEQIADRKTMYHTGRSVDPAGRVGTAQRIALIVKIEEAAVRVHGAILEEIEQPVCLIEKPALVMGQVCPFGLFELGNSPSPPNFPRIASKVTSPYDSSEARGCL